MAALVEGERTDDGADDDGSEVDVVGSESEIDEAAEDEDDASHGESSADEEVSLS